MVATAEHNGTIIGIDKDGEGYITLPFETMAIVPGRVQVHLSDLNTIVDLELCSRLVREQLHIDNETPD